MTQEIQNKLAFVVIDSNTMERISKFYSRVGDAKAFISARCGYRTPLSIAVFTFKEIYYVEASA